ncbi:MAG: thioredoxin family protein [Chloroflexota bacterium]|nr:thioredoxin family protein [Chloroflexota bacterium]
MPRSSRHGICIALFVLATAALAAPACGASSNADDASFPKVISLGKGEIFPSILNQSLAVGPNRVSIGLTGRDDNRVLDATVHLRFYNLNDGKSVFSSEAEARFVPVDLSYVDEQSPTKETSPAGSNGVYVATAGFDAPGDWGVKISITRGGRTLDPVPYKFNVLDHSSEPGIGDPAPPSVQQTLANVSDIEQIDSSYPSRRQMHQLTVADAITSGRPTVVAFATPAFCRSRTCAPVMDTVIDPLYAKYATQANFLHIEPYDLAHLRAANIEDEIPATREWKLQSEPWVFVIDRQGKVAAKFEGIMAEDEVELALKQALGQ